MKIDQICWYAHNDEQVEEIKKRFGLLGKEWIEDTATGNVLVRHSRGGTIIHDTATGLLRFNYDLGIELEILTYLSGAHWHAYRPEYLAGETFMSHIGIHMEPGEKEPDDEDNIVQEMVTTRHTNPYVVGKKRTYRYVIRDTTAQLGCFTKYIWRIGDG